MDSLIPLRAGGQPSKFGYPKTRWNRVRGVCDVVRQPLDRGSRRPVPLAPEVVVQPLRMQVRRCRMSLAPPDLPQSLAGVPNVDDADERSGTVPRRCSRSTSRRPREPRSAAPTGLLCPVVAPVSGH